MQKLIDANKMLEELKLITYDMEQNAVTIADMSNIMRNWVCRQPTIPAPQWISVEDRLPEDASDVLVVAFWHEKYQVLTGWHSLGGWLVTAGDEERPLDVTHWMPLPTNPKDGGE